MDQIAQSLIRQQCLIGGQWTGEPVTPVYNPATGVAIGRVPNLGGVETRQAIEAAHRAFPAWSGLLAKERAVILKRWCELLLAHAEEIAQIMTAEQGKPLAESRGEVAYGASFVEFYAEEAKRVYGETIPTHKKGGRIIVHKQPVGVIGAITPWNFPFAMITRKVSPALAVGCTVVIKPAPDTPLTALALGELAKQAGIPDGVLNIITGDAEAIGRELTSNPTVRAITFTGSTRVGKILMEQSASTVKKVSLELGGNAPFIVFDDADLDKAVDGAIASKFRNMGQTCVCANRILVQDEIYEQFSEKLAARVSKMKVGPGNEEGVVQGPLINEAGIRKVEAHVQDALSKGAMAMVGGKRHKLGHTFFEPTVLIDVNPGMRLATEETFGPVAPLFRFKTEEQAITFANSTPYGLAAYFYSRDVARVWRVTEKLEFGIVGVNDGIVATEVAPFGGVKESGLGREGSRHGLDEFLEMKYMFLGGLSD
jgi:succinate-semialdehyde dehydrogenase/glutarate-semialdehyde dehydrogenase